MNDIPQYVEQGFRWGRETVELIYSQHKHPLPMVAMIFMYAETLGKPLLPKKEQTTEKKVCKFIEQYLPKLWSSFSFVNDRSKILGKNYRNGLVHQMFMKNNCGIHEGGIEYVSQTIQNVPYSINIDMLVPEFIDGINKYYNTLLIQNRLLLFFIHKIK